MAFWFCCSASKNDTNHGFSLQTKVTGLGWQGRQYVRGGHEESKGKGFAGHGSRKDQ
jgi:hypothetical protein